MEALIPCVSGNMEFPQCLWIIYRILLTLFSLLCVLYRFILSSTFFSNLISAINSLNETDYSYFMFISNIWCHEFMITTQLPEL